MYNMEAIKKKKKSYFGSHHYVEKIMRERSESNERQHKANPKFMIYFEWL